MIRPSRGAQLFQGLPWRRRHQFLSLTCAPTLMVELRAGNENLGLFLAPLIFRPLVSADG